MSLESFPPLMLVCARFIISGSIMLAAIIVKRIPVPRGPELARAALSGFLILGVGNGCLTFAELQIPSGLACLILTMSPFWLVGIEAFGGERLHPPSLLGMVVGFLGAALLFAPGPQDAGINRHVLNGFLILQAGMISWSFGSIYQRRQNVKAHPIVIGAVHQLAAGLAFLPLAVLVRERSIDWSVRGTMAILYLVFFGSVLGYSAYAYALDRLPVAVVSIYPYVNAAVAVTLGWVFYREPFRLREGAAMAIIFTGVALVKWHSRNIKTERLDRHQAVESAS